MMIIKAFFAKFKLYFMIIGILGLIIGTWQVQEWRHDAKTKSAIEKAVKDHKDQQEIDQKLLLRAEIEKQELRGIYNVLKKRMRNVESAGCFYDGDYIRLWNEANRQAGASITD